VSIANGSNFAPDGECSAITTQENNDFTSLK
jgi:hypothetical protein